jgi:predicted anti-sigma-YlaC factor YlaD
MTGCAAIRESIQDGMDGPLSLERHQEVTFHLRACSECREYRDGLEVVRDALRLLPEIPFPADALDSVWSRTIRAGSRPEAARPRRLDWRIAAVAAATVTLLLLPSLFRPMTGSFTPNDLARAGNDTRRVLALAGEAIRKTRHAAVTQVLGAEVSPALRKIPIHWSSPKRPDSRRTRT